MSAILPPYPYDVRLTAALPVAASGPSGRVIALGLIDLVRCRGQLVGLPRGRYDWLRLELSAPPGVESVETAWLHYAHGTDPERLVVSPAAPEPAWLPVPRRDDLLAVRLPDRPELIIHSLALVVPATATGADVRT